MSNEAKPMADLKHVEGRQMSPEELLDAEKSLKRKLDIRLLFCVWVIFVLNYLDRVCYLVLLTSKEEEEEEEENRYYLYLRLSTNSNYL
jgi:hypothetical protein